MEGHKDASETQKRQRGTLEAAAQRCDFTQQRRSRQQGSGAVLSGADVPVTEVAAPGGSLLDKMDRPVGGAASDARCESPSLFLGRCPQASPRVARGQGAMRPDSCGSRAPKKHRCPSTGWTAESPGLTRQMQKSNSEGNRFQRPDTNSRKKFSIVCS